jgi:hypothetical protein
MLCTGQITKEELIKWAPFILRQAQDVRSLFGSVRPELVEGRDLCLPKYL